MRVFLTGATGYIGQALARTLRQRGWTVEALVRRPDSQAAQWLASIGVGLVRGDVASPDAMRESMGRADVLIHNAGTYEYGGGEALRKRLEVSNVEGTARTLSLALELKVPRTVYVSTVLALGATGSEVRDESFVRQAPFASLYEESKTRAHEEALQQRARGLPLVIVMPNAVIGPNDHSVWGYLLRLYLMRMMPPMGWGADTVFAFVDLHALCEGIVLAAERAAPGQDYIFAGEPMSIRQVMDTWRGHPGGIGPRLWLPPWLMKLQFAPMEPLQRMLGLPAVFSRETVDVALVTLNYRSDKARRDLGWEHPSPELMWQRTIHRERELLDLRRGVLAKLRPMEVAPVAVDEAV